ncbi:MAG: DUF3883 domain-containing protein [Verrucomicrobia bacterium]|nr:MAG: DUF3883 domain-containing protein [Verrucomicrobiota bacterium]
MTILQRRLASSPEAIYQSLHRRRQRLESRLRELELFQRANAARPAEGQPAPEPLAGLPDQAGPGPEAETPGTAAPSSADGSRPGQPARPEAAAAHRRNADAGGVWIGPVLDPDDLADLEDAPETEVQQAEEAILDEATAAASLAELRAEIAILRRLEALAARVRRSGVDTKWRELAQLLAQLFTPEAIQGELREEPPPYGRQDPPPPKPDRREKLVIFTEHRATLDYLRDRIATLLGRPQAVVAIHGGLGREERRKAQESFLHDPEVQVLVATDAAGEGINLQRAHFMVNYDLPWNPNRLEQRFGRIHRIGQTEVCYLWNLVATETREGDVYERLLEKLDEARRALGGQVFDVLGKLQFEGRSLKDLLIEAIRYGERPEVRARLHRAVENPFDHAHIRQLLEHRALAEETMDTSRLIRVREAMERAEARRLQPHYIESFFLEAFKRLGGAIREREPRRYEITHVPARIRRRDRLIGIGEPVLSRYERVVFEKELIAPAGKPMAAFVCPGHPLLQAVLDLTLEHHRGLLRRGAILVDERDPGLQPRLLVFLEHAIQDATLLPSGEPRTVSRRLLYVEMARAAAPEPASEWAAGSRPATNQDTQDGKGSGPTNDAGVLECGRAAAGPLSKAPEGRRTPKPGSQPASDPPFLATTFHYAPYLDYRPLRPDEPDPAAILTRPEAAWLHRDLERLALQQALTTLVPEHLREVRERRLAWIEKTRAAVRDRLTKEIAYWDSRAEQLKLQEQAGKPNARLNSREARARADELAARLQRRLAELDRQAHLSASPPVVVGAALVVPLGLLHAIRGEPLPPTDTPADTQTSAARARAIVMEIERSLGYEPVDREPEKLGYDIESRDPRTGRLRFLEVKGRVAGAPSLTVTRNEILTSLNKPDDYILAIVEFLDDGAHRVHYIRRPFQREPDFGVTSVNYSFAQLLARAEPPA